MISLVQNVLTEKARDVRLYGRRVLTEQIGRSRDIQENKPYVQFDDGKNIESENHDGSGYLFGGQQGNVKRGCDGNYDSVSPSDEVEF